MNNRELKRAYELFINYEVKSEYDAMRLEYVRTLISREVKRLKSDANAIKNNGLYGDVFEVLNREPNDTAIKVATQNKADAHIIIGRGSKAIELKTQEGRIESLYNRGGATYVIYQCFLPYNRKGVKGETPSKVVIMTKKQFLEGIEDYGTVSKHSDGERFVRVKKAWFDFINECMEYDRTKEYTLEMFK